MIDIIYAEKLTENRRAELWFEVEYDAGEVTPVLTIHQGQTIELLGQWPTFESLDYVITYFREIRHDLIGHTPRADIRLMLDTYTKIEPNFNTIGKSIAGIY